jgi:NAD(P)-dependent dehydrogenase (short-subunit alcohol dehydrogenase family)
MKEDRPPEAFPHGAALIFGASGGIGAEVARVLAEDGANLALVYNSKADVAQTLANDAEKIGRTASIHQCNAREKGAVAATVAAAVKEHGRIHTLVWAAGPLVEQKHLAETTMDAWRTAFEIEAFGLIDSVTSLLPHMREHGGGSVVHLGSAGQHLFPERDGLSVVPKAANESFLQGIAREEGRFGIRANSVTVGVIDAGMFKELMAKGAFPDGWAEEVQKSLCLKRFWPRAVQPMSLGKLSMLQAATASELSHGSI